MKAIAKTASIQVIGRVSHGHLGAHQHEVGFVTKSRKDRQSVTEVGVTPGGQRRESVGEISVELRLRRKIAHFLIGDFFRLRFQKEHSLKPNSISNFKTMKLP